MGYSNIFPLWDLRASKVEPPPVNRAELKGFIPISRFSMELCSFWGLNPIFPAFPGADRASWCVYKCIKLWKKRIFHSRKSSPAIFGHPKNPISMGFSRPSPYLFPVSWIFIFILSQILPFLDPFCSSRNSRWIWGEIGLRRKNNPRFVFPTSRLPKIPLNFLFPSQMFRPAGKIWVILASGR